MEQPIETTAVPGADTNRRQRGVALIITLGFISLLFMLALGFLMTTRSQLGVAQAKSDLIATRLLAESGLNRAMADLKTNTNYYSGTTFILATNTAWGQRRCYMPLSTSTSTQVDSTGTSTDAFAIPFKNSSTAYFVPKGVPTTSAAWVNTDTTQSAFIGRYSYVIIDESGKIDPNGVTSSPSSTNRVQQYFDTNTNGTWDSGEFFFRLNNTGTTTTTNTGAVAEGSEVRTGGSPQEINLANAFPSNTNFLAAMPSFTANLNGSPLWFSWAHLGATGAGDVQLGAVPAALLNVPYTTVGTANETIFDSLFPYSYDIEAYYDAATSTDYHRFDLSGQFTPYNTGSNFWDTTALTGSQKIAMLLSSTGKSAYYTSSASAIVSTVPTTGIPWLASIPTATQVAANLIDYCDADNIPTNDYTAAGITSPTAAAGYTPPSATYMGRECVPYINEINIAPGWTKAGAGTFTYLSNLKFSVELVNLNTNTAITTNTTYNLALDVTYTTSGMPAQGTPASTSATVCGALNSLYGFRTSTSISVNMSPSVARYTTTSNFAQTSCTWKSTNAAPIVKFSITSINATLTTGTPAVVVDFAKVCSGTNILYSFNDPAFSVGSTTSPHLSFQVADPRYNLAPSSWTPTYGNSTAIFNLGSNNGSVANPQTPSGAGPFDPESSTYVASGASCGISTAYIANRPMQSLWELGCIHRGSPWQTINLKKMGNDGAYTNGDAAILDQVKLGPFTSMRGRVNVNSRSRNVWNALGGDVRIGWNYSDLGGGAVATGTAMNTLNSSWITTVTTALTSTTCNSRGAVAAALTSAVSASVLTDAGQEELIGKLANLLTTRQNYFTIIVTAQLLGLAGSSTTPNAFRYDYDGSEHWCVKKAEQRIMAVVRRDAYTNTFKIERLQYIDE